MSRSGCPDEDDEDDDDEDDEDAEDDDAADEDEEASSAKLAKLGTTELLRTHLLIRPLNWASTSWPASHCTRYSPPL